MYKNKLISVLLFHLKQDYNFNYSFYSITYVILFLSGITVWHVRDCCDQRRGSASRANRTQSPRQDGPSFGPLWHLFSARTAVLPSRMPLY